MQGSPCQVEDPHPSECYCCARGLAALSQIVMLLMQTGYSCLQDIAWVGCFHLLLAHPFDAVALTVAQIGLPVSLQETWSDWRCHPCC